MPRIAEFYGIIITMYYNDHNPAHFPVTYGEYRASVSLTPLAVIEGELPRRAQSLVVEWAAIHQVELTENWDLARERMPLFHIAPLD
ncbi:MAG: DUF4160 domain-containing protein [Chloroflexi bacterium]|nr:DUF4160 domain-containing protein [Chloroflexota bacterium]